MINPYKTLEVDKSASQDEIKKAYKKLARKYHPDANPGDNEAEARFKELNEAYQLIGTAEARKKYDNGQMDEDFIRQSSQARDFHFSFEDLDNDIFESLFGGGFSDIFGQFQGQRQAHRGQQRRRNPRGQDAHSNMEVSFEESIMGTKRVLVKPDGRQIEINIPSGIKNGQKLRYKNQGHPSPYGGPKGNLYIEVKVKEDPKYKRIGDDLEIEAKVPLETAIAGGEITINNFGNQLTLKVPKHSSSGRKLRVRGKGVKGKGDLFVRLIVVLPEKLDDELAEILEDWARKKNSQNYENQESVSA